MSDNSLYLLKREDFFPNNIENLKKVLNAIELTRGDFIDLNNKFFTDENVDEGSAEEDFFVKYITFLHAEKGFNWNQVYFDIKDGQPENLALYLIENNYPKSVVRTLFNNGFNPNVYSMAEFETPIFMHCLRYKKEYIPLLLDSGADVYKSNSLDENFIKYCIDNNDYELFKNIIKDNPLPEEFKPKELNRFIYGFSNLIHYDKYENISKFFNDLKETGINENSRMSGIFKDLFDKYKYPKTKLEIFNLVEGLFNNGLEPNLYNKDTAAHNPIILTFIEKFWTYENEEKIENLLNDKLFSLIFNHTVGLELFKTIKWDEYLSDEEMVELKKWVALKEREKIIDLINDDNNSIIASVKKRI